MGGQPVTVMAVTNGPVNCTIVSSEARPRSTDSAGHKRLEVPDANHFRTELETEPDTEPERRNLEHPSHSGKWFTGLQKIVKKTMATAWEALSELGKKLSCTHGAE